MPYYNLYHHLSQCVAVLFVFLFLSPLALRQGLRYVALADLELLKILLPLPQVLWLKAYVATSGLLSFCVHTFSWQVSSVEETTLANWAVVVHTCIAAHRLQQKDLKYQASWSSIVRCPLLSPPPKCQLSYGCACTVQWLAWKPSSSGKSWWSLLYSAYMRGFKAYITTPSFTHSCKLNPEFCTYKTRQALYWLQLHL